MSRASSAPSVDIRRIRTSAAPNPMLHQRPGWLCHRVTPAANSPEYSRHSGSPIKWDDTGTFV